MDVETGLDAKGIFFMRVALTLQNPFEAFAV